MKCAFDGYTLDTDIPSLSCDDGEIALEPKAFDLLVLLIAHRERFVSKDEIVEQVWQGRFTSDSAITTCIKTLRKALGDDGDHQRVIRTQRGRGFRFVGTVAEEPVATQVETILTPTDTASPLEEHAHDTPFTGKPSIIVLPFQARPGIGDLVFAEAIAHDLIQSLSRLRWLRVIARGTAFRFHQPDPDLAEIGRRLDVRYALCGAIEVLGGRHSVAVELSNCASAEVIWADRFEIQPDQMHEMREQILACIISTLEIHIPLYEASHAHVGASEHLDAWANYHLGLRHMFRFNPTDNAQAAHHFNRAVTQDPQFARAYAGLSFTRFQDAFLRYDTDFDGATADARRLAEKGIELDPLDPFVNYTMGRSFWLEGDAIDGLPWLTRSVDLSPNFAQGYYACAFSEMVQGAPDHAIQHTKIAHHLSPLDPLLYAMYASRGLAHLRKGEIEEAVHWADKGARAPGAHHLIHMIAAAICALGGEQDKAIYWRQRACRSAKAIDVAHFFVAFPFSDEGVRKKLRRGLKLAQF